LGVQAVRRRSGHAPQAETETDPRRGGGRQLHRLRYERCIVNLVFHHVEPSQKSFPMSMAVGRSIAAFREEAKKCVLVCANCHGEIEAGIIPCPPPPATYATWGAILTPWESGRT